MATVSTKDPGLNSNSKSKKSKKKKVVKEKSVINAEELVDGIEGDSPSNNGEDGTQPEHEDTNTVATLPESTHSRNPSKIANGTHHDISDDLQDLSIMEPANSLPNGESTPTPTTASQHDTSAKIDALAKDRIALRDEVALLRKSLEELQGKHDEELSNLRSELEETQGEKEHADTQYRNLLGRVNTIKSQLGERLKSDAEELSKAREKIEELEETNSILIDEKGTHTQNLKQLKQDEEERSKELSTMRNRLNLSSQNWSKEREDLSKREAYIREELEMAKQAMQDWEVLAMEERSIRENLGEKAAELEEQVIMLKENNQNLQSERSTQALNVDGLQRALRELQEARKQELREIVENSQSQVQNLQTQLKEAQETTSTASKELEGAQRELERLSPMENEVKEKNLLIMKLKHETVILNDHLTKAFKQLKKGKSEDTVDRQLITNNFLQFLAIDRSDPKKFQVLQIIASILNWTEEQRESAGLSRPGTSNPSLRTPISPWNRTPSTPNLSTDFLSPQRTPQTGVSLGGLWSDFLETESNKGGKGSRSTSVSSSRK